MTAQELYRLATRKKRPIELLSIDPIDALEALTGSRRAAQSIAAAPLREILGLPIKEALQRLEALPGVGPGMAAKIVLAPWAVLYMADKEREENAAGQPEGAE